MRAIVLSGQRTGYNATEDNGDDTGSKLSRKGNGSARVGAKWAVHDNYLFGKGPLKAFK